MQRASLDVLLSGVYKYKRQRRTNCFKSDHQSKDCKICNLKHNSMLHITRNSENQGVNQPTESTLSINACQVYFTNVLLPTAIVKVFDNTGRPQKLRALLDSN
jgi:hypothetical protein